MTMKLYSWDLSPYSARVRMQIYAKGLTDIAIEQPPTYGTLKFYQDHPIGRIPLLEVDGEAIPESAVIAEYLEEIYPEPSLLGATPRENANIRSLARIGDPMNNTFMLAADVPKNPPAKQAWRLRAASRGRGTEDSNDMVAPSNGRRRAAS